MKNLIKPNMILAAVALLAVMAAAGGTINTALAQGSEDRAISRAQRAVRERIVRTERGNRMTVTFNEDAQADVESRNAVRVSGTGTFSSNNDSRYRNSGNTGMSRDFTYQATVSRNRSASVSGVSYNLSEFGNRDNDGRGRGRDNDGRGRDDNDRDDRDRDDRDRDDRDYRGSYGGGERPNGRVSYSGPISNRHSDKSLDVTERSNRDGANIQQWGYSDQPNQNWDIIDLGNGEVAIISRQSGRALTAQGGRDQNGTNIIQRSWRGAPQQRWRLEQIGGEYYRIVSVDNGKSLDVTQAGRQDGANIQLWDYVNQSNQQWRLRK